MHPGLTKTHTMKPKKILTKQDYAHCFLRYSYIYGPQCSTTCKRCSHTTSWYFAKVSFVTVQCCLCGKIIKMCIWSLGSCCQFMVKNVAKQKNVTQTHKTLVRWVCLSRRGVGGLEPLFCFAKCFCLKLLNVFVSNCKMYLSQIAFVNVWKSEKETEMSK